MAKKRVHEIAKERGISSKEVIARLQSAGFDVKAAASSVDERDIAAAFSNGARGSEAAPAPPASSEATATTVADHDLPAGAAPTGDGAHASAGEGAGEAPQPSGSGE